MSSLRALIPALSLAPLSFSRAAAHAHSAGALAGRRLALRGGVALPWRSHYAAASTAVAPRGSSVEELRALDVVSSRGPRASASTPRTPIS